MVRVSPRKRSGLSTVDRTSAQKLARRPLNDDGGNMKTLLTLIGIIVLAAGLFFMAQGAGYIQWPAESFMVSQFQWVYYGGGIALVGLLLIILARR
jgi:hypothetical protein